MTWHILLADADGQRYTSSPLSTREDALSFARDLVRDGSLKVLKIEHDRGETIDLEEVQLWSEAARLGRTTSGRA